MDADKDRTGQILKHGVNRAGSNTVSAVDAELLFHYNSTAFALGKSSGRAGLGAWRRIAGQTVVGGKTGGQASGRANSYSGCIPGDPFMYDPGTGKRTGVAAYTAVDFRCGQYLHGNFFPQLIFYPA